MRTDDMLAIRGRLWEDGICSPKELIDCAGWAKDRPQRYLLAEVMQYLIGIGNAAQVPQGFQGIDNRGREIRARRGKEELPRVSFDVEKEMKKGARNAPMTGACTGNVRTLSAPMPYDREKATVIIRAIERGQGIKKGCEEANVPLGVAKHWRKKNPDFRDRVNLSIKTYGNATSNAIKEKTAGIREMLIAGASYKEVATAMRCGKSTATKIASQLHAEGIATRGKGRAKKDSH